VNSVEAGLFAVEQMMYGGKLKAFKSLPNWYSELRSYRRDTKGKVVKERDHLMDAMRYLIMSGLAIMQRNAVPERQPQYTYDFAKNMDQTWMQ
jgi:Terminase RNaseH-like domain